MTSGSTKEAMAAVIGQKFVPSEDDDGVLGHEGEDVYSMDFSAEHIAKSNATISGSTQLQRSFDLNELPPIASVNNNESVSDLKIANEWIPAHTQEKIHVEMASSTPEERDSRLVAQSLRAASANSGLRIAEGVQVITYHRKVREPPRRMEESGGPRLDAFKDIVALESSEREEHAEVTEGKDQQQQKLPNQKKRSLEISMRESKKIHTAEEKTKFDEADSVNHTQNPDTDETDHNYSDSLGAACKKRKSSAEQMDHDPEGGREVREADERSMDDEHAGKLGTTQRVGGGRSNSTEFAAITPKNIDLIYLRRALLRELLDDPEFHNKVVGTFVRIRVPLTYRLVLVIGTRIGEVSYKAGTQTTKIMLEILNLQKQEVVTVNVVSDLDFTEEECQRLRQSIKYGFIEALTVAQVEDKAIALREDKLNYWFKSEKERWINLKDRASEKGRKKELRECVEKLQKLSNPAFRAVKFEAMPEVTFDPHMDPRYESDSDELQGITKKLSPKATRSGFNTLSTSSFHVRGDFAHDKSKNSWEDRGRKGYHDGGQSSEKLGAGWDSDLGMEGKYQSRDQDCIRGNDFNWGGNDSNWGGNDSNGGGNDSNWGGNDSNWGDNVGRIEVDPWTDDSSFGHGEAKPGSGEMGPECGREVVSSEATLSVRTPIVVMSETEKLWHYQDPTGKVHGPFTMGQLRTWNKTGLFPVNLTIWKTGDKKENSEVMLIDALAGRFNEPLVEINALAGSFKKPLVTVKADDGESGKSMYGSRRSGREYDGPALLLDGSLSARGRLRLERKGVPCRYYARGYCRRGDACEFRHG